MGWNKSCNVPSRYQLEPSYLSKFFQWEVINSLTKNPIQSDESFEDQKLSITTCLNSVDSYQGLVFQDSHTKNVGIHGFPSSGTTWCMMYFIFYENSKVLKVTTTSII